MKKLIYILVLFIVPASINAQIDSLFSRLSFNSDFRFRIEQDWNSKMSDGSFREDRSRLRYRLRAGATYKYKWYEVGFRIRTGNPIKQQDPQLTLGDVNKEFGTLPIGIEKAYFQGELNTFTFWVGKNSFSFKKNNELFWSNNVFPEGVFIENDFIIKSNFIDNLNIKAGHYIIATSNESFDRDSFFQGFQISTSFFEKKLSIFPSLYIFKNIPNIPDGNDSFSLNYSIMHLGTKYRIVNKLPINVELDYYKNLQDYSNNDLIQSNLKDQKSGFVIGLKYGEFLNKGDWLFTATYTKLEKFSAVDFLAQNDWARWDYSSSESPDGRLTNFSGIELAAGYKIDKKVNLKVKYYFVEQIIALGNSLENGSRIRLDIDIKF